MPSPAKGEWSRTAGSRSPPPAPPLADRSSAGAHRVLPRPAEPRPVAPVPAIPDPIDRLRGSPPAAPAAGPPPPARPATCASAPASSPSAASGPPPPIAAPAPAGACSALTESPPWPVPSTRPQKPVSRWATGSAGSPGRRAPATPATLTPPPERPARDCPPAAATPPELWALRRCPHSAPAPRVSAKDSSGRIRLHRSESAAHAPPRQPRPALP